MMQRKSRRIIAGLKTNDGIEITIIHHVSITSKPSLIYNLNDRTTQPSVSFPLKYIMIDNENAACTMVLVKNSTPTYYVYSVKQNFGSLY